MNRCKQFGASWRVHGNTSVGVMSFEVFVVSRGQKKPGKGDKLCLEAMGEARLVRL